MGILINFHEVNDPVWFDNIVYFLKKKYTHLLLPDLINLYHSGNHLNDICHLTVDDGDKSFYKVIFPVLKKHKIPATIYVSPEVAVNQQNFWFQEIIGYEKSKLLKVTSELTGISVNDIKAFPVEDIFKCFTIDKIWEIIYSYKIKYKPEKKSCQNMSVNELREVEKSGLVTIGAHTLRHPILANEEMTVSKNEISQSITNLADILGHEIAYFSYPNGLSVLDFGQREMDILKDYGCKCSVSTISGNFTLGSGLLDIPRYGLSSGNSKCYVNTKFLFGSHWNNIMKLKPGNEAINRKAILKILSSKM